MPAADGSASSSIVTLAELMMVWQARYGARTLPEYSVRSLLLMRSPWSRSPLTKRPTSERRSTPTPRVARPRPRVSISAIFSPMRWPSGSMCDCCGRVGRTDLRPTLALQAGGEDDVRSTGAWLAADGTNGEIMRRAARLDGPEPCRPRRGCHHSVAGRGCQNKAVVCWQPSHATACCPFDRLLFRVTAAARSRATERSTSPVSSGRKRRRSQGSRSRPSARRVDPHAVDRHVV